MSRATYRPLVMAERKLLGTAERTRLTDEILLDALFTGLGESRFQSHIEQENIAIHLYRQLHCKRRFMLCVLAPPADDARPKRRSAEEQKESPAAADRFPPFPTHEHVFGLEEDLSEDDEPEAPAAPVVPDARRMTREERYAARGKAALSDDVEDLDGVSAAGDAGATSAATDEEGFDSPSESAGRGKTARSPSAPGSGGRGKKKQRAPVAVRLRMRKLVSIQTHRHLGARMATFDPLDESRSSSNEGGDVTTAGAVVDSEPEPEPVAEETGVIRRTIYGRDYELSFESLGTLSANEWRQRCIVRAFAEERLRAQLAKLRRGIRANTIT